MHQSVQHGSAYSGDATDRGGEMQKSLDVDHLPDYGFAWYNCPNKSRTAVSLWQDSGGSVGGLGRAYAIAVLLVAKPAFNVIVTQVHFLYKPQVFKLCYQQRYIALPQKDARGDLSV